MKIDCLKKQVDLNKIHYAIDCFRADHKGEYPSYIVMNYETRSNIMDSWHYYYTFRGTKDDEIREEEKLFGIPVAYNKALKFGEVDVV